MEWYIYSKKNNDKFTLPCELLVVLSTKSLAILCESSFTEVHLISLNARYKFVLVKKILLVYVTSSTEMSLKRLTNKNLASLTETWKSESFSQG